MVKKNLIMTLLILVLLQTTFVVASTNDDISYINSKMDSISKKIQAGDFDNAKAELVTLNSNTRDKLGTGSFYLGIIDAKEEDPNFSVLELNKIPDELNVAVYSKKKTELRKAYDSVTVQLEELRYDLNLARFKTAMAIVLNAAIVYNDAMGMSTAGGKDFAAASINQIVNYKAGETVGAAMDMENEIDKIKILKNNLEIMQEKNENYEVYYQVYTEMKANIFRSHRHLKEVEAYLQSITTELEEFEVSYKNVQNQISSATGTPIIPEPSVSSFSETKYIQILESAESDLKSGDIGWVEFSSIRTKTYDDAKSAYDSIKEKNEQTKDSFNSFYNYYMNQKELVDTRNGKISELNTKLSAWKTSFTDFLKAYDEFSFDDNSPATLTELKINPAEFGNQIPGSTRYEWYFDLYDGVSKKTSYSLPDNLGTIGLKLNRPLHNGEEWYDPIFSHCNEIDNQLTKINLLVNYGRESAIYQKLGGTKAFVHSYLLGPDEYKVAISNYQAYGDYLNSLSGYGQEKSAELNKIKAKLETVNDKYQAVVNYADSSGIYITQADYCYSTKSMLKYDSDKLDQLIGSEFQLCEFGSIKESIDSEIDYITFGLNNFDSSCDQTEISLKNKINAEQEKYNFVTNFEATANELMEECTKSHVEINSILSSLRYNYGEYKNIAWIGEDYRGGTTEEFATYMRQNLIDFDALPDNSVTSFITFQNKMDEFLSQIVGFSEEGKYLILKKDEELFHNLRSSCWYKNSAGEYFSIDELKKDLPTFRVKLNEFENPTYSITNLAAEMAQIKSKADYATDFNSFANYLAQASQLWKFKVLKIYVENNGWRDSEASKQSYEAVKKDYLDIMKRRNELHNKEFENKWNEDDFYNFIPGGNSGDPMDRVLLNVGSVNDLEKYGLSSYEKRWIELHPQVTDLLGVPDDDPVSLNTMTGNKDCYATDVKVHGKCYMTCEYDEKGSAGVWHMGYNICVPKSSIKLDGTVDLTKLDKDLFSNVFEAVELCEYLNTNIDYNFEVPSYVPFTSETLLVYASVNWIPVGTLVLKDKKIASFECGTMAENFDYELVIENVDVINGIIDSESPVDAIDQAFDDQTLILNAASIPDKIKTAIAKVFANVLSWFM